MRVQRRQMRQTVRLAGQVALQGDPETVWRRVTSVEGIARELGPWLRMTTPPGLRGRTIDDVAGLLGSPLGRSWVLLLGVLPVEFNDMRIVEVRARSFREESTTATTSRWVHQRSVTPTASGCELLDELELTPRAVSAGLAAATVRALFRHRHRRLAAWDRRQVG